MRFWILAAALFSSVAASARAKDPWEISFRCGSDPAVHHGVRVSPTQILTDLNLCLIEPEIWLENTAAPSPVTARTTSNYLLLITVDLPRVAVRAYPDLETIPSPPPQNLWPTPMICFKQERSSAERGAPYYTKDKSLKGILAFIEDGISTSDDETSPATEMYACITEEIKNAIIP